MWVLELLPYWVFHAVLLAGLTGLLASFALKFIPVINTYKLLVQIAAILLIIVGAWFEGSISNNNAWQARVKDIEAKLVLAEAKSQTVNTEVVTKTITKIKVIREKTHADIQYITKYVAQELDADCRLTSAGIMLHNSASTGEVSGSPSSAASNTSPVKASELLTTVVENYGTYYQVVEQVKGWQEWYQQQKKVFEAVK